MSWKTVLLTFAATLAVSSVSLVWAQAPAGSTGQCKDSSYTSADAKRGACRGHGGVKEWYATTEKSEKADRTRSNDRMGATNKEGTTERSEKAGRTTAKDRMGMTNHEATTETQASKPMARTNSDRMEPAAGGGAGKVWVNTATHVYHCEGTRWYGKTKNGEYMSEAEAKSQKAHADHGKACA